MSLETEIATALTAREIASEQLAALIEQVIAVTAVADEEVTKQRQKALDPTAAIDVDAVSSAIAATELRRDRLKAALPRLQERFLKVEASERYATWVIDYDRVQARRDAAAAELRALYAPLVTRLADLLERIETIDAEVNRVNSSKPMNADAAKGDGRILCGVETHARGAGRFNETLLVRDLKIPHWSPADGLAWPPYRPALPFKLSELEERQINQQRLAVLERARAAAGEVERQQAAAE